MATIIRTIRNIQSVISVSQTINPIAPIIIVVITIAANNFIRSITIYILQSKPFNSFIYIHPFQVSFTDFLTHYISYSFHTPLSKFHNTFYQGAEFQLTSFFLFIRFKYRGVPQP